MTQKIYWNLRYITKKYDIRHLLPPSLERSKRFETEVDAAERAATLVKRLAASNLDEQLSITLEHVKNCPEDSGFCGLIACPICSRRYRVWASKEFLRLFDKARSRGTVVTTILKTIPAGELNSIDATKIASAMRQRIRRSAYSKLKMLGGIELSYKADSKSWILHTHLLILGCQMKELKSIGTVLTKEAGPRNTKMQSLKNAPAQLSYLLKFQTYHRPGQQVSNSRARAYPLPTTQLIELLSWWNRMEYSNLLFLFGVRRRGRRLIEE
jgi:hypothetical protein